MVDYDLAIIGGGINGTGIARDAAGRGLSVLLVEQNDLASGTSSASSKLIHGGLRYLEQGAFRLVREALAEREILLRIAPHVVRPLRFVLPPQGGLRSPFLLRVGLFLYDHLGRRRVLPGTRALDFSQDAVAKPLRRAFGTGFEYSDCYVDDSRLVVLNALDAAERGATVRPRTRCVRAERAEVWRLILSRQGRREPATARVLVNAAGPWVGLVGEAAIGQPLGGSVRLDKGSHIVVRSMFDHGRAYILQAPDRRVVFALPYEGEFTLIGTTDESFAGDPALAAPSAGEITYLCKVANGYFRKPIGPADVVWCYSGVRALYEGTEHGASSARRPRTKAQDVSRDYHLAFDERPGAAPLMTVIGGKITTYRALAEAVLERLAHVLPARPAWTAAAPLPGGDFGFESFDAQVRETRRRWPFLAEAHAARLVHAYGTRVAAVMRGAERADDLGERFGADLTAAEVRYLMRHEWALTEDDVLWRRSKLGLRVSSADRERLGRFMAANAGAGAARA